jgi:small subunit ribosomal protein S16
LATRIRLTRRGRTHTPVYRVVVADGRAPRDGKFLEQVGFFDPTVRPHDIRFDAHAVVKWLEVGAQPTDRVWSLIRATGIDKMWEAKKSGQDISNFELVPAPVKEKKKSLGPKAKARLAAEEKAKAEAEAAKSAPAEETPAE